MKISKALAPDPIYRPMAGRPHVKCCARCGWYWHGARPCATSEPMTDTRLRLRYTNAMTEHERQSRQDWQDDEDQYQRDLSRLG